MVADAKGAKEARATLAELMGLTQKPIRWSGVGAFLLGHWAMTVLGLLMIANYHGVPPLTVWIGQAARSVLLTAAVAFCFRVSRDQIIAAILAAVIFTAIWWGLVGHLQYLLPIEPYIYMPVLDVLASPLALLLGLVIMLRLMPAVWLGLAAGSLVGAVAYGLVSSSLGTWTVARALAFSAAFWGALCLFKSPAGAEAGDEPPRIGPA